MITMTSSTTSKSLRPLNSEMPKASSAWPARLTASVLCTTKSVSKRLRSVTAATIIPRPMTMKPPFAAKPMPATKPMSKRLASHAPNPTMVRTYQGCTALIFPITVAARSAVASGSRFSAPSLSSTSCSETFERLMMQPPNGVIPHATSTLRRRPVLSAGKPE